MLALYLRRRVRSSARRSASFSLGAMIVFACTANKALRGSTTFKGKGPASLPLRTISPFGDTCTGGRNGNGHAPRGALGEPVHAAALQLPASTCCNSSGGALSGQVATPSGSVSHGCFRLTQIWATMFSSSLLSNVPARSTATSGRALFEL